MINFLTALATWIIAFVVILAALANLNGQPGPIIVGVIAGILFLRWLIARTIKKARLMKKYQDEMVVKKIMNKVIWVGATKEMIKDSWGSPGDVKQGSHQSEWCYQNIGKGRWKHRIKFRGGEVVSFTER